MSFIFTNQTSPSDYPSLSFSLSLSNMQRQSLGSPVSKLHSHGGDDTIVAEDPKRRVAEDDDDDDGERKATKARRLSFSPSSSPPSPSVSRPEKFIHLIPVLTLLCFLILYLSSHAPSQSGMCVQNLLGIIFQKGDLMFLPLTFLFCFDLIFFGLDLAHFAQFKRPSKQLGIMQLQFRFIFLSFFALISDF